jgi:glycosyltransferase involved in cell wall biosynthesis
MKRAAIFNPYWKTLGGGEKYTASFINTLIILGYQVDIFWHEKDLIGKLAERFEINLDKVKIDRKAFEVIKNGSFLEKRRLHKQYNLLFWVSDGSLPFLFSGKNLVHFQVPFHKVDGLSLINQMKKSTYDLVVCNSQFTKKVVDREYGFQSKVIYPPATMIVGQKKEQLILSVGRFDNLLHNKRQDVLIKGFKKLNRRDYRLVLAGGSLHSRAYVRELKEKIGNYPIELVTNPSWSEMAALYAKAAIYWHAAGYEVDEKEHPEQVEHFGLATVEAMSAGAVPMVFAAGGQREIINHGTNGYLWETLDDLVAQTEKLIEDKELKDKLRDQAEVDAQQYSVEAFEKRVKQIVG